MKKKREETKNGIHIKLYIGRFWSVGIVTRSVFITRKELYEAVFFMKKSVVQMNFYKKWEQQDGL